MKAFTPIRTVRFLDIILDLSPSCLCLEDFHLVLLEGVSVEGAIDVATRVAAAEGATEVVTVPLFLLLLPSSRQKKVL